MTPIRSGFRWPLALAVALSLASAPLLADAQTTPAPPAKKAKAPPKKAVRKAPAPPAKVEFAPAEPATPEQLDAAERVYYGAYECEFKQTIDILRSLKYPGFVDVKHAKALYLMKPVLSSTGAIRLEDIRGETLMVQISSKSMLLNVQTAHRIVDDCVSARQRELIEAARVAKAAAAASASESGQPAATRGGAAPLLALPVPAASPSSAAN